MSSKKTSKGLNTPFLRHTFGELGVSAPTLHSLKRIGFVNPTPIQHKVIPTALNGKDLIGCAQTGTGKTAAFVIPMAERIAPGNGLSGLILCPTREIALQTHDFIKLLGKGKLTSVALIGGVKMAPKSRH